MCSGSITADFRNLFDGIGKSESRPQVRLSGLQWVELTMSVTYKEETDVQEPALFVTALFNNGFCINDSGSEKYVDRNRMFLQSDPLGGTLFCIHLAGAVLVA